jgi:alpha-L-fucosidase 2
MDYNTGATAAIAEMLLQSHQGYLHLLPTLPAAWPHGSVSGVCGRGGFVVDLAWQEGVLTRAHIVSRRGGPCRVRADVPLVVVTDGSPIATTSPAPGLIEFVTKAGGEYGLSVFTE